MTPWINRRWPVMSGFASISGRDAVLSSGASGRFMLRPMDAGEHGWNSDQVNGNRDEHLCVPMSLRTGSGAAFAITPIDVGYGILTGHLIACSSVGGRFSRGGI